MSIWPLAHCMSALLWTQVLILGDLLDLLMLQVLSSDAFSLLHHVEYYVVFLVWVAYPEAILLYSQRFFLTSYPSCLLFCCPHLYRKFVSVRQNHTL